MAKSGSAVVLVEGTISPMRVLLDTLHLDHGFRSHPVGRPPGWPIAWGVGAIIGTAGGRVNVLDATWRQHYNCRVRPGRPGTGRFKRGHRPYSETVL